MAFFDPKGAVNTQDEETGKWTYEGAEESMHYVYQYAQQHGPYDGVIAMSQVRDIDSPAFAVTDYTIWYTSWMCRRGKQDASS